MCHVSSVEQDDLDRPLPSESEPVHLQGHLLPLRWFVLLLDVFVLPLIAVCCLLTTQRACIYDLCS